ncbi:MAG: hypothetical protein WDM87_15665 [Terracidiphilus sp.]
MTNLFLGDDSYHGGAFMLAAGFGFYAPFFHPQQNPVLPKPEAPFDFGTPDNYKFFLQAGNVAALDKYFNGAAWMWDDQYKHDTYDDYWKSRDLSQHMKNVKCAFWWLEVVRRGRSGRAVPDFRRDTQIQSGNAGDSG